MSEEDLPLKKKKISIAKKNTESLKLSGEDVKIPAHIENAIKEAFLRFSDLDDTKKFRIKDLEHLDNIVQEYLKAFIILGYDFNGEKVHIFHAASPFDRDALVEHLRTTLIGIINNNDN
jgi:hypothetical protein